MYGLDVIHRLRELSVSPGRISTQISPTVWALGLTSMLTDISSEMVSSALPAYLVLQLRLTPVEFGIIDGIYQGFALVLFGLIAGAIADRDWRHKLVAQIGYSIAALSKIGLYLVGSLLPWLVSMIALDRLGKSIRTSPRDALISLHTREGELGVAFGVHRAMDALGAMLGPFAAFLLLLLLPGRYDFVWLVSAGFAICGVAAISLLATQPGKQTASARQSLRSSFASLYRNRRLRILALCGCVLSLGTISDSFIYLMLHQKTTLLDAYLPLFFVGTSAAFLLFAVPAGMVADAWSRTGMFIAGNLLLLLLYFAVAISGSLSWGGLILCLMVLGLYYAMTEGVLYALTSTLLPVESRGAGIALVASAVALGKLMSSMLFGSAWHYLGSTSAVLVFSLVLAASLAFVAPILRNR